MVEQRSPKPRAEGSSPSAPASMSADNGLTLSALFFIQFHPFVCSEQVSMPAHLFYMDLAGIQKTHPRVMRSEYRTYTQTQIVPFMQILQNYSFSP